MKRLFQLSVILSFFIVLQACEEMVMEPDVRQTSLENVNADDQNLREANMRVANYVAHLSGEEEVPSVDTKATGQVKLQLSRDESELHFKLIVANIENVFASHIHMAPAGVNGPVVVGLYGGPVLDRANGVLAEGTITSSDLTGPLAGMSLSDLVTAINEGNTYVNVHTTQNPPGEIRGQIK